MSSFWRKLSSQLFSLITWFSAKSLFKRGLAAFLCVIMLWPHLSWAFEPRLNPKNLSQPVAALAFPTEVAQITQSNSSSQPRLFHIQDLHCQYETQANIAKLLDYLQRTYGVSLILMEGASQRVNVAKLSTFPVPEVRQAAGDYLMRLGKLSGAEYYAATSAQPVILEGLEQADLYQAERICLKKFYNFEAQGLAQDFRDEFNQLKTQIYSPAAATLDHYQTGFNTGTLSLLQYAQALLNYSRQAAHPLPAFPELLQYLEQNQAEPESGSGPDNLTGQIEQWARQLQVEACRTAAERDLAERLRGFAQIEACLNLGATFADISEIRQKPEAYDLRELAAFLANNGRPQDLQDLQTLEGYFQSALHFYALADQRSLAFAQRAREALRQHPDANIVLITGGYHTQLLTSQFKQDRLPYCSVKLRRPFQETENPYSALLSNPRCLLENLLVPPQPSQMALPPFFEQTATAPESISTGHALSEEMVRSYDFLEGLVKALNAANDFTFPHPSLEALARETAEQLRRYPADSGRVDLDLAHAQAFAQAVLIPVGRSEKPKLQPFIVIYPQASRVALPSPVSLLTIHGNRLGFYPAAMRGGIEKSLRSHPRENAWKIFSLRFAAWAVEIQNRISATFRKFSDASGAVPETANNGGRQEKIQKQRQGKTTVLPVLTELVNDLKLAAGLLPILERLSPNPPSWLWTLGSLGAVLGFIGVSSVFSNWLLAKKQHRVFTFREIRQVIQKEWADYRQSWVKLFATFWENRKFQPQASWLAMGLLLSARMFDYGTQVFHLQHLPMILAYSAVGVVLLLTGWGAMRHRHKTVWYADIIKQSLRILEAVLVVQVLKLPFAFALLAFGASEVFADRINDAFLKGLKKVIGVLSFAELFTSLRNWILKDKPEKQNSDASLDGTSEGKRNFIVSSPRQRMQFLINPHNPITQLLALFLLANILFMNFYFNIPFQLLLILQGAMGVGLILQWLFIFKNVQVSQKVKLISLTGILPAVLLSALQV
ncbi:MAG: hypothetical protein HGA76_10235, partial [Candidatus Firestonebacteria bacterium]|nr:hypothetical protein [Candidatus Firestonebacteria bacterium]